MLEARGEWSAVSLQADWLAADGAQRRYGLTVALLRAAWRLASGRRSCWSGLASGSVSQETDGILGITEDDLVDVATL